MKLEARPSPTSMSAQSKKPLVLLVDDVATNLDVLLEQLSQENIDIRIALSGEEGLHLARSLKPDLILLDVMMPGMDGYEVCRLLKQDSTLTNIPVVFLTAHDEEIEVERGFALGAVDYIHKPFSLPILKARVRSHLALKLKSDLLEELASTDGLTQVANRRRFDETLAYEWERAQRGHHPLSLIMVDVDHFKHYNDHFGHSAGDQCLQSVAKALSNALHRPGDLLARFGGEEFAVLLPDTELNGAIQFAEKLRRSVSELNLQAPPRGADRVSISLGVACILPEHLNAAQLLAAADAQLYQAKREGRNRVAGGRIDESTPSATVGAHQHSR